jgi:hypothetical protein
MDFVIKYMNKPWNWNGISSHKNLTMEFVKDHIECPWDWYWISRNKNLTMEFIKDNIEMPWDFNGISRNPNLTCDFIDKHIEYPWDWSGISASHIITIDFIEKHIDKPWDWQHFNVSRGLTFDIIKKYNNKIHCGDAIMCFIGRSASMDDIEKHIKLFFPWDWRYITMNPNLTVEFIMKYSDVEWDWHWISQFSKFIMEIIDKYSSYLSDILYWDDISRNPNISEYITESKALPWNWKYLTNNPNITFNFITKHLDKPWDWKKLSYNRFTKERNEFILQQYRRTYYLKRKERLKNEQN